MPPPMPRWRDTLFAKVLMLALGVALLVLFLFGALAMQQFSRAQARATAPLWAAALRPALGGEVQLPAELPTMTTMKLVPGPPPPDAAELRLYPRFRFIAEELRELGMPVREVRISGRTGNAITWLGFATAGRRDELRWIGVRGEYEGLDVRTRGFVGFALALLVIGWAAWKLSRRITRPVSELQQAIQRFGREGRLAGTAAGGAAGAVAGAVAGLPADLPAGTSAGPARRPGPAGWGPGGNAGAATSPAVSPGSAEAAPAELRELVRQFEEVAAERAALDTQRRTMLAAISHDLRSPLGRIRMAAELLPAHADGVAARRDAIVRNVQVADRLLGSFIDFARTDGEPFDQPVDLADLVQRLGAEEPDLEIEVASAAAQQIAFAAGPAANSGALGRAVFVVSAAHPLALERALRNLVDNARRHGAPPVQVSLGLRSAQWAELTVRDHGCGIPGAQDRARLLLPFQRGEQGRGTPGTGLGLAIVARVAERCAGRLLLEEAAPGLRAVLLLPVRPPRP
ncbi:MAG: hypothetical protein JNJ89_07920 [Rubrivivax sp.]|nr:hypothetical protein [Rubrivivax sp.]